MTTPWHADAVGLTKVRTLLSKPENLTVGVLGLGISGQAVCRVLLKWGAQVVGVDARPHAARDLETLASPKLRLVRGETDSHALDACQLVVASPGISPKHEAFVRALSRGVPVVGELELVHARLPESVKVAVITGTNGKSTTTSLVGSLLGATRPGGLFVGGNLGPPIGVWLAQEPVAQTAVLEVSSYQLDGNYQFRPDVACILNVSSDHLERYGDFETYAKSKARLAEQVAPGGLLVLNYDDHVVRRMADNASAKIWWIATRPDGLPDGVTGLYLKDDGAVGVGALAEHARMPLAHPALLGRHNRENALAALAVTLALSPSTSSSTLVSRYRTFSGLPHRLELVCERDGVRFVNDSKATNDAAAAIAVSAMDRPALVLMGGRDKNGGYLATVEACRARLVREVFAYGEAAEAIAQACLRAEQPVRRAPDLLTAARLAAQTAHAGDVVLLAPACSSFDAFTDYAARGEAFAHFARTWHASSLEDLA